MKAFQSLTVKKALPWILIICGAIGLICAFIIMYEKVELLKNPNYSVPCNLDPVISCGSVMESKQASTFGFPNPFIGLMAFPVVITSGVLLLMGGARVQRWYMRGLNIGALLGLAFVHWLFIQSVWHINALCPWCMVVWAVTITTFLYVTVYNLREGIISVPASLKPIANVVSKHHLDILFAWFLAIFVLIMHHFWYFYGSKFGF